MYLRLIRPNRRKAESGYKGEFEPKNLVEKTENEKPVIKAEEKKESNLYALLTVAELRKIAAERGISFPRNATKAKMVEILGGAQWTE